MNNTHQSYSNRSQLSKSIHHQLDLLQQDLTMNDHSNTQSNERNHNNNIPCSSTLTEEHVDELLFNGRQTADNRYQKEVDSSSPAKKVTPGSLPSSPSSSLKQPRTFLTETIDEDDDYDDEEEDGGNNQGIYPERYNDEQEEEEEEIRPTEDLNSSFVLQQQKSSKTSKSKSRSRSQPSSLSSSPNRQQHHQQPTTRSIPVSMVSSSLEEMKKNFFQEMESKWNNSNKHHSSSSSSPLSTPRTSTATTNLLLKDANIPSATSYDLPRALKEIEKLNRIKESLLDTLFENKQYIHNLQDLFQQEKENQLEKTTEYDLSIENYQLEIKHLQKQLKALSTNNNLTEIYAIFEKDCLRLHKENELLREQLTSLELKELSAIPLPVAAPEAEEERRPRSPRKGSKDQQERPSSSPSKTIGTNIGKGDKKFVMARIKESKSGYFLSVFPLSILSMLYFFLFIDRTTHFSGSSPSSSSPNTTDTFSIFPNPPTNRFIFFGLL
jgi:hypothetical protein